MLEKDNNINVVAATAKSLSILAQKLGPPVFSSRASNIISIISDRFKEKKAIVRDPLIECIDLVFKTTV